MQYFEEGKAAKTCIIGRLQTDLSSYKRTKLHINNLTVSEMKRILSMLAITLVLISANCSAAKLKNLIRKPNEAIIVAKIQIKNGDSFRDNKWSLLFNERLWAKWCSKPDDQNYIYMKVPLGKSFIALIQTNDGYHTNIPNDYLSIDIKENKIYYIGDIVLYWTIDKKTPRLGYNGGGALGGVLGAVSDSKKLGEYLKADVIDNYNETTVYFNTKFTNTELIEKELLKINTVH